MTKVEDRNAITKKDLELLKNPDERRDDALWCEVYNDRIEVYVYANIRIFRESIEEALKDGFSRGFVELLESVHQKYHWLQIKLN